MSEHWCKEHNTAFFKKGKMKGFAHPIGDTGEWCNMPEGQEPVKEAPPPETKAAPANGKADTMTPDMWRDKDKAQAHSIERQVIFKGIVELLVAKVPINVDLQNSVLDWAKAHFDTKPIAAKPASSPPQSTSEASEVDESHLVFADAGEILNYMKDIKEMNTEQRNAATAAHDLTTPEGRADCWACYLVTRRQK